MPVFDDDEKPENGSKAAEKISGGCEVGYSCDQLSDCGDAVMIGLTVDWTGPGIEQAYSPSPRFGADCWGDMVSVTGDGGKHCLAA